MVSNAVAGEIVKNWVGSVSKMRFCAPVWVLLRLLFVPSKC